MTLSYNLAYQEIISVHPTRRQILLANRTLLSTISETLSYLITPWQGLVPWFVGIVELCLGLWG